MYRPDRIVPEPLSFYGIQGQEERDTNEFSYFNFIEAREVCILGPGLWGLGLNCSSRGVRRKYEQINPWTIIGQSSNCFPFTRKQIPCGVPIRHLSSTSITL
eukprot:sb/3478412/